MIADLILAVLMPPVAIQEPPVQYGMHLNLPNLSYVRYDDTCGNTPRLAEHAGCIWVSRERYSDALDEYSNYFEENGLTSTVVEGRVVFHRPYLKADCGFAVLWAAHDERDPDSDVLIMVAMAPRCTANELTRSHVGE